MEATFDTDMYYSRCKVLEWRVCVIAKESFTPLQPTSATQSNVYHFKTDEDHTWE
jgi:hypothetical protein